MGQTSSPAPDMATSATVQTLPGARGRAHVARPSGRAGLPQQAASSRARARGARLLDELAERRERARAERQEIETRADSRLHEMQAQEFIRVPRLMVAVTSSLAAASVLELARLWTERSLHERGTPWVDMPVRTWLNYTGLCEQEWVEARRALRDQRLIQERRRFDLDRNELVCDLTFDSQVFDEHVANLRDALKAHLVEEVRARHRAERGALTPPSTAAQALDAGTRDRADTKPGERQ
ncbi:MAG: hypothetical protein JNN03_05665 [Rubrivivax sp.]|nr:hypothetical protein [Rubrivivax sp.]